MDVEFKLDQNEEIEDLFQDPKQLNVGYNVLPSIVI